MVKVFSVDDLWNAASPGDRAFRPDVVSALPETARRYLEHDISPSTKPATAVRLRMHGEIKLKRWLPFAAEQAIVWNRGFIWSATVRINGLPVKGFDRLIDGDGAMRWKLLGLVPVMTASGPDIARSAAGRMAAELCWLPSILCSDHVSWTSSEASHANARLTVQGEAAELDLAVDGMGRVESVKMRRWGDPDGSGFRYADFGAVVEGEGTFDGYTMPTRLRAGWYFGTPRFETEGEFFRCTVDESEFR